MVATALVAEKHRTLAAFSTPFLNVALCGAALLVALAPAASSGSAPTTGIDPTITARIDAQVNDAMTRQHVPGLSLAVARRGRLVYAKGYGYRDVDDHLGADADTRYEIESITKEFTAGSILLLQQQRRLSLDDRLSKFVTTFRHATSISLRQLLSHTSGIVGYTELPDFERLKTQPTSPEAIVETIAQTPLAFEPGTAWQYSNTNYVLLGMVIERVSGKGFGQFLADALFKPLRMSSTAYNDPLAIVSDRAHGYSSFFPGPVRHADYWDPSWAYAAGGVVSTAVDLIKWDLALTSHRVLSEASFREMVSPTTLRDGTRTRYGLGVAVGSIAGHRVVMHEGGAYGFKGNNSIIPDVDLDVAVLGNSDTFIPETVVTAVLSLLAPSGGATAAEAPSTSDRSVPSDEGASTWIHAIQSGHINRDALQQEFSRKLDDRELRQLAEALKEYGTLLSVVLTDEETRGASRLRAYRATFAKDSLEFDLIVDGAGKTRFRFEPWN